MKRLKNILITWEGMITIPVIVFMMVIVAGFVQSFSSNIVIFPEQYFQEIMYKTSVLVMGSTFVQIGIVINLMLFFGFKNSDLKQWFTQLSDTQKLWVVVCFYALYYLVFALVRL